jgi:hypothetical protein
MALSACGGSSSSASSADTQPIVETDTKAPIILSAKEGFVDGSEINIKQGESFDPQLVAVDAVDGIVSVSLNKGWNDKVVGYYPVEYQAKDSIGNTSIFTFTLQVHGVHRDENIDYKVLLIGIDGMGPGRFAAVSTPNLDSLISEGVFDNNTQLTSGPSWSGVGWSDILSGVKNNKHLVTNNSVSPTDFATYPSFIDRIERIAPELKTAVFTNWGPLANIVLNPDLRQTGSGGTEGKDTDAATKAATHISTDDPDAIFVHLDQVDHAGHSHGGISEDYDQAIKNIDSDVGIMLSAIKGRANYEKENWLIMIASDHGHKDGGGHGGSSTKETTVYYLASGPSTEKGSKIDGGANTLYAPTALQHILGYVDPAWDLDGEPLGLMLDIASMPVPSNNAVMSASELKWGRAMAAVNYNVHFGTDKTPPFVATATEPSYSPSTLADDTTYYWRIDTVTAGETATGETWSFTTLPAITDDLVVRLPLDTDASDISGRNNTVTITGTATYTDAKIEKGIALEANEYLDFGTATDLNFTENTDFTVSLWIKTSGWTGDPSFISNKDWNSGSNIGWFIGANSNQTEWKWNYRDASGNRFDFDGGGTINDDTWHHILVTHDRDGEAIFYHDGVVMGSVYIAGNGSIDTGLPTLINADGTKGFSQEFSYDDVSIWRRVLSAGEVENIFEAGNNGVDY